jgi:hypothetical protein
MEAQSESYPVSQQCVIKFSTIVSTIRLLIFIIFIYFIKIGSIQTCKCGLLVKFLFAVRNEYSLRADSNGFDCA